MTISAKILLHTKSAITGAEAITWELEYPRFIHAELMTHRVFSRNAASSRAIPVNNNLAMIRENPAMPVHWGKNQPGMQAKEELTGDDLEYVQNQWYRAANMACDMAFNMNNVGAHKQIVNRIVEPFVHMKVIVTSTERRNWYELRYHEDAQPEIFELAKLMRHAEDCSKPILLYGGQWHLPYINYSFDTDGIIYSSGLETLSITDARKISASLCAQVSYRKADESLEKAIAVYDRLIKSKPLHASPFEHQLKVEKEGFEYPGWTHIDRNDDYWSGNIRGYVQYRQLLF